MDTDRGDEAAYEHIMKQDEARQDSRSPNDREAAILSFLLSIDEPEIAALRPQAENLEVKSTCGCGCASIGFTSIGKGARYRPVADAFSKDDDDPAKACGVTLFVDRDEQLSYLEIYSMAGWEVIPHEFPLPEQFEEPELARNEDLDLYRQPGLRAMFRRWWRFGSPRRSRWKVSRFR